MGVMTLLKLFDLEPMTKAVFDIKTDHTPSAEELKSSGNLIHAIRMFQMFDAALNMLGPDTEVRKLGVCMGCMRQTIQSMILMNLFFSFALQTLNEILKDLGKRHINYGVSAVRHVRFNRSMSVHQTLLT